MEKIFKNVVWYWIRFPFQYITSFFKIRNMTSEHRQKMYERTVRDRKLVSDKYFDNINTREILKILKHFKADK